MKKLSRAEKKKMLQKKQFQEKRDYLTRERGYEAASLAKCKRKWSKMLNEISCENLRIQVIDSWHRFEKAIDYKEVEISLYMDWINEENIRYWMTLTNLNQSIDSMINFFYRSHKCIYDELASQVDKLITQWVKDYDENKIQTDGNEEYLETMRYQLNCIEKREEYESITRNFSVMNEKTLKAKMQWNDVNYNLSKKFEKVYTTTKSFTHDYFASVRRKHKEGAESRQHCEQLQKEIDANIEKSIKLDKLIQNLIKKLKDITDTDETKLDELKKERDYLHHCFLIFREKLFSDKKNEAYKQQILTVSSNESFSELEKRARKGSIMLKCLRACRQYETKREKILPFPDDTQVIDRNRAAQNADLEFQLNLFFNKMAGVDASRHTLNEERIYLKKENQELLKQIHSFCNCLQCPSVPQIPQRAGKIPYTEGREMVQKTKTQNGKRRSTDRN